MGTVIRFPFEKLSCNQRSGAWRHEPASVVILPAVRIERWSAERQQQATAAVIGDRTEVVSTQGSREFS
ncbi:MAG TPA: hypothetical protein VFL17_20230, partial [Anaerolineae bacterium]|nr:hypothetical protein [Anaerolineae bacterium]